MEVPRHGNRVVTLGNGVRLLLEPGAHDSPYDGVCVVELASVLAGEEFSDHPRCVCEVVGGFLRSWNDRAGHFDRQRLYPYAARVVGSAGKPELTRLRRDICLTWAGARLGGGPLRRALARLAMRARIAVAIGIGPALRLDQGAGEYAARLAFTRGGPDVGFALLEELLAVGEESSESGARNGSGNGHGPAGLAEIIDRVATNGHGARPPVVNGNGNGRAGVADGEPDRIRKPVATP